eukprot:40466_1
MLLTLHIIIYFEIQSALSQPDCNTANQCIGQSINYAAIIYGNGYKSLYGPTTSITSTTSSVVCSGAFSCYNVSSLTSSYRLFCGGTGSCSNIETTNIADSTLCFASNSCQYTVFDATMAISSYSVDCWGDQSCTHSDFLNVPTIYAYGAYSLYNATIYGNHASNKLDVTFDGYQSGFGAKIYCQFGNICTINCNGNGCQMLYVQCIGSCVININSASTIRPIIDLTDFDGSKLNLLVDSVTFNDYNEAMCNSQSNEFTFDNYNEAYSGSNIVMNTNGPICCRASKGCYGAKEIIISSTNIESVICSGEYSCNGQSLAGIINNNNGPVFCEGNQSCMKTNISTTDNVYCFGRYSCRNNKISKAQNIYCTGSGSCQYSIIISSTNITIYLLGKESATGASIYCNVGDTCTIVCGGADSCIGITALQCNGFCAVECNIDTGCPPGFTLQPTNEPTTNPINQPTIHPTINPTIHPTSDPSINPIYDPTYDPTIHPTINPSINPIHDPTYDPTVNPIRDPTINPTELSNQPSIFPTQMSQTTNDPTNDPSINPI